MFWHCCSDWIIIATVFFRNWVFTFTELSHVFFDGGIYLLSIIPICHAIGAISLRAAYTFFIANCTIWHCANTECASVSAIQCSFMYLAIVVLWTWSSYKVVGLSVIGRGCPVIDVFSTVIRAFIAAPRTYPFFRWFIIFAVSNRTFWNEISFRAVQS